MAEMQELMGESSQSRLRKFRPDIEGFRALAILMVVIHHAGIPVFGGVDTSFVLSGFLVTSVLLGEVGKTGKVAFGRFYARRARRLLPAATTVIVATLIAAWIWLPVFKLKTVGLDGLFSAVSAINWRLAAGATDYFADNTDSSPFQHFWSLAVEEQFYVVWPALFLAVFWLGRRLRAPKITVGVTLAIIIGVSLHLSVIVTRTAQPWAYFGFHTRAWELAIGGLVAVMANLFARVPQLLAAVTSWAGLVVIGAGSVVISHSQAIPGSVMLWSVLGTAMFIIGGCAAPRFGAEVVLGHKTPRFVGRLSYGWYLWHWPALIIAPYVVGRQLAIWENLGLVMVSLALAAGTYYWVERPIKAMKSLVDVPAQGLAFGARIMTVSALAALVLVATSVTYAAPGRATSYADPSQIAQLVKQAAQTSSLSPLAEQSLGNVKQRLYAGCLADIPVTVVSPCQLGDTRGAKQIVVLGSSLAWQWLPALDRIAQQIHARLTVFAKGSCPAERYSVSVNAFQDGQTVLDGPYLQCDVWRQSAYMQISSLHPQLVIMASRVEPQVTAAVVMGSVEYFRNQGVAVAMIAETPRFGLDVPGCVVQHHDALQRCAVRLADAFPNHQRNDLVTTAAAQAGATIIDPLPWLCTDVCPPVIDDIVAYQDDHHLSAAYATWLTPLLAQALPQIE